MTIFCDSHQNLHGTNHRLSCLLELSSTEIQSESPFDYQLVHFDKAFIPVEFLSSELLRRPILQFEGFCAGDSGGGDAFSGDKRPHKATWTLLILIKNEELHTLMSTGS